jgi:hypothetical protein
MRLHLRLLRRRFFFGKRDRRATLATRFRYWRTTFDGHRHQRCSSFRGRMDLFTHHEMRLVSSVLAPAANRFRRKPITRLDSSASSVAVRKGKNIGTSLCASLVGSYQRGSRRKGPA